MQTRHRMLRVAAATTMTVIMTVGAVGPVHATGANDNATASNGKGAQQSASARGSETKEAGGRSSAAGKAPSRPAPTDAGPAKAEPATTKPVSATTQGAKPENHTTGRDHSKGNASTRGDSTKPQPESRADRNDGGANAGSCETDLRHDYCSTRDGSPSMNGNGGGAATGKPCAGCVGKADNKNPKGQYPDGGDRNAGYECDTNNGIGKSNPAHTGCTTSTEPAPEPTPEPGTPEPTCPEGASMNDEGECVVAPVEQEVCPEGASMTEDGECVVPAVTTPAGPGEGSGEVLGVDLQTRGGVALEAPTANRAPAQVAGVSAAAPAQAAGATDILPATGAGSYLAAIVAGLGLLAAGGVLLARRRPQASR